jgi:2-polyprenyl-3-methyl-5-hydroxy-6-metoxy-1,4-benzoquinol methylase
LNLGCGHGILDLLIAKKYNVKLHSVEFSKNRIYRCNYLKDRYNINNVTFIHDDINVFLENNINYDIIMAFEVIEHLYNQKEVIAQCRKKSKEIFLGTIPIQPNCKQKQHISYFKSINDAKNVLGCNIYEQVDIPLRLPECVFFINGMVK